MNVEAKKQQIIARLQQRVKPGHKVVDVRAGQRPRRCGFCQEMSTYHAWFVVASSKRSWTMGFCPDMAECEKRRKEMSHPGAAEKTWDAVEIDNDPNA